MFQIVFVSHPDRKKFKGWRKHKNSQREETTQRNQKGFHVVLFEF